MENGQEQERWVGYVDWRNRPAFRGKHGGMFAASFVLVVEVMENLAFLANASNLVTYLMGFMHFSPSHSATTVTNFMGTAFLLALLGGFLSDAFFTTYVVYLVSALIEFLGLVILTIQAKSPSLKPPACEPSSPSRAAGPCEAVSGAEAAMLFGGLYLTALGVGGIKGSLPAHGAEQFDEGSPRGRAARSTFFNYFVFCLSCGGLAAVTFVVWVEDNKGWEWGFGISTIAILLSIPVFLAGSRLYRNKLPTGSPLTLIAKVLVAAALNCRTTQPPSNAIVDRPLSPENRTETNDHKQEERENGDHKNTTISYAPSEELKFLNRAAQNLPRHLPLACTAEEVEEVKVVLKILPIFLSTIMLNCCLAQLSTFSVEQAATMDTRVGRLTVPPASLPIFPVTFIMILAPVYDHIVLPFARRVTKTEVGITHLQRIGTGLVLSIVSMAIAALVEVKRKNVAQNAGLVDSLEPLPISFFWIALQYLFLGSADLFTLAGLLEFFFSEAPARMRSLATALSWASLAMGYYLSSVLVSIVNSATGRGSHWPWLKGSNLNHYRLERFYWLMCVLSSLNYLFYLFWALRYKYRRGGVRG
ncbi:protein NRT1/ PTR FAMILY 4.6-like [Ananas comosus]|uniref:Protein NRT1/ PTR FAMILY 4.6-like n=1 Tax=Ananas comosus TaxID=4615 RepID=A0A6P5EVF5_ANACO|nr:protein NRT1/ PTR FAMILY 4.6-like [Ananas comosus]XP_020087771.1 protein NRT1/ PTR FAMILY 4.6-like [Ananas comosus]